MFSLHYIGLSSLRWKQIRDLFPISLLNEKTYFSLKKIKKPAFVKPIMDNRKHFSVYNLDDGEEEDDVLDYSAHSTLTGTIYLLLNIDGTL